MLQRLLRPVFYQSAGELGEHRDKTGEKFIIPPGDLRRRRTEPWRDCRRSILQAMCRTLVNLAGPWFVLTRHSPSRNTVSMIQCRLYLMAQRLRMIGQR